MDTHFNVSTTQLLKIVSTFVNIFDITSLLLLNWKNPKLACEVKGCRPVIILGRVIAPLALIYRQWRMKI